MDPKNFKYEGFEVPIATWLVRGLSAIGVVITVGVVGWKSFGEEPPRNYVSTAASESAALKQAPAKEALKPQATESEVSPKPQEHLSRAQDTLDESSQKNASLAPPVDATHASQTKPPTTKNTPETTLPDTPAPAPPVFAVRSRGSVDSIGQSFPSYEFMELEDYCRLAERHGGLFIAWNPNTRVAVRIGTNLQRPELTTITQRDVDLLGLSRRMADVPITNQAVQALAVHVQNELPDSMVPVRIVLALPIKLDQKIAEEQEVVLNHANIPISDRWKTRLQIFDRGSSVAFVCKDVIDTESASTSSSATQ